MNAYLSTAVLAAFLTVFALESAGHTAIVPCIDPLLVTVAVLLSISVPVRMAWVALMALLNRAPSDEVVRSVRSAVDAALEGLAVRDLAVRVIQPGRALCLLARAAGRG